MTTLAEAARSLGAGWVTVIVRVVAAEHLAAACSSAAFLTVALVLGEFTFASLLNFPQTCRYVIASLGKSDAPTSVAASLAALLFAFVLLLLFSLLGRRHRSAREA